jgi:hypothetical protein
MWSNLIPNCALKVILIGDCRSNNWMFCWWEDYTIVQFDSHLCCILNWWDVHLSLSPFFLLQTIVQFRCNNDFSLHSMCYPRYFKAWFLMYMDVQGSNKIIPLGKCELDCLAYYFPFFPPCRVCSFEWTCDQDM